MHSFFKWYHHHHHVVNIGNTVCTTYILYRTHIYIYIWICPAVFFLARIGDCCSSTMIVDTVCTHLSNNTVGSETSSSPSRKLPLNRHNRLYVQQQNTRCERNSLPLAYRHAVEPHLQRYKALIATPLPWSRSPVFSEHCENSRMDSRRRTNGISMRGTVRCK